MSADASLLLGHLRTRGRAIGRADLLACGRAAFDDEAGPGPDRIRKALEALEAEGAIKLPSRANKEKWDRSTSPALPLQVSLRAAAADRKARTETAWASAFAFASRIPASAKRDAMVAINDHYVAHRGTPRPIVPYRVRSAQILGDEKAFDRLGLVEGATLCGQAPLDLIGAYNPDLPLVREDSPSAPGTTMLIVENAHAYDLIALVNRSTGTYRSVAWGGGNRVAKRTISALSLRRAMAASGAGRLEYAGDLDPEGLRIAASLHAELAREGFLLHPAAAFYDAMLRMPSFPAGTRQQPVGTAIEWLPAHQRAPALAVFERGHRVAQEIMDHADVAAALNPG